MERERALRKGEQAENSDHKSRPSEELTAETPAHSCPTSSLPARKANKQKWLQFVC